MTTETQEAQARAAFEKHEREENGTTVFAFGHGGDQYAEMRLQNRWRSWLACWNAAWSARPQSDNAWTYVQFVYDKFKADLDRGYITKDKEFAVELLAKAICRPQSEVGEVAKAAFEEASRRFKTTEAQNVIAFLEIALGYATAVPDEDDIAWANAEIERIDGARAEVQP